jgi:hypothetical protein
VHNAAAFGRFSLTIAGRQLVAEVLGVDLESIPADYRPRYNITPQIRISSSMTTGPDLSGLSDAELRVIELGNNERLTELYLCISKLKSTMPSCGSR